MWTNWSGQQSCTPAETLTPRSTDEVVAAVVRAAEHERVVRVAGAGHSFAPAVLTDGTLLVLDAMDRVLDADPATGRVRVQAGIRIDALADALAPRGLGMENLGDIKVQALAGALATATHGTGALLGNLSTQVTALQVVDGSGGVREVTGGDELLAARVAVGALGVVTEVELRCVPVYTLRGVDAPMALDDVLDDLDGHVEAHRHFECFAFPFSATALTRANDVVESLPQPIGPVRRWLEDDLVGNTLFGLACDLGVRAPALAPLVSRALAGSLTPSIRVDRGDRVFASVRDVRFTELEYAVPRAALPELVRGAKAAAERHRVAFPIEVRVVAGDDALLSPAHGRDTGYCAVHVPVAKPYEPYFREVEAIADGLDGRPHWGKRHFQTAETLAPRYPGWERFQAVRAGFDPDGRFANAYVHDVLGPVPEAAAVDAGRRGQRDVGR